MRTRCGSMLFFSGAVLAACTPVGATMESELVAGEGGEAATVETASGSPGSTTRTRFVPPPASARVRAIGRTAGLSEELQRAFTPTAAFELLLPPQPGEWLAEHYEPGQSYREFVAARRLLHDQRDTIYLVRLGPARDGAASPTMATLAEFARAYFDTTVGVLPDLPVEAVAARSRPRDGGQVQLYTADILDRLERHRPEDGRVLFAITERDLYPREDWAFAFGEASRSRHTGVESLVRLDPTSWGIDLGRDAARTLATRRALTVMAHEIGHLFGLKHCIFFRCVMGGGSDLRELDGAPLHLCPVCLRKLHRALAIDPDRRYRRLHRFYREHDLTEEAEWAARRADFVRHGRAE